MFDDYKSKNNLSGMDATIRAIQEIQMKNGIDVEDYAFASSDRTTRVSTDIAHTFSLDDIHDLQKRDDVICFLGGTIPAVGPVLGTLTAFVIDVEQNGKASIGNTAKNIGLGALGAMETGIGLVASGVDTGISMNKPKNDTYNRDGVTIQAGDIYILLRTETNQGLDVATIQVYVRDDKIISYDNIIKSKWKKDGYK
ncbi:hypothetical protein JYG23_04380 [Sedimentibacter sp. zth1]|uniref:hypothetical protein n=1 Tax=Sedimentibacter sp. zth1 TaxID=2816908 RepID=UPI001A920DA0|nr:hypothetical protein [Sedimentibacter sp. zth1]QSX06697.1 hypothetical protein JYG23_04380 [Sedimentibacter sp. zth1]